MENSAHAASSCSSSSSTPRPDRLSQPPAAASPAGRRTGRPSPSTARRSIPGTSPRPIFADHFDLLATVIVFTCTWPNRALKIVVLSRRQLSSTFASFAAISARCLRNASSALSRSSAAFCSFDCRHLTSRLSNARCPVAGAAAPAALHTPRVRQPRLECRHSSVIATRSKVVLARPMRVRARVRFVNASCRSSAPSISPPRPRCPPRSRQPLPDPRVLRLRSHNRLQMRLALGAAELLPHLARPADEQLDLASAARPAPASAPASGESPTRSPLRSVAAARPLRSAQPRSAAPVSPQPPPLARSSASLPDPSPPSTIPTLPATLTRLRRYLIRPRPQPRRQRRLRPRRLQRSRPSPRLLLPLRDNLWNRRSSHCSLHHQGRAAIRPFLIGSATRPS